MSITRNISSLPTPPSRSDPVNFNDRADEFLGALPGLQAEINDWTSQANALAGEVNAQAAALLDYAGVWTSQSQVLAGQVYVYNNILWRAKLDSQGVTPAAGDYWEYYPYLTSQDLVGRNVIVNGDFSVWQQGEDITTTVNNEYTADCWLCQAAGGRAAKSTLHGSPYSLWYTGSELANHVVFTRLESIHAARLAGKTATLSYNLHADQSAKHNLLVYYANAEDDFSSLTNIINEPKPYPDNSETRLEHTFDLPAEAENGLVVCLQWVDAAPFSLSAFIWDVQLEKGCQATRFEYLPHDIQLLRCMRYYERLNPGSSSMSAVCMGGFWGSTVFVGDYKFKVPKRVRPTLFAPSGTDYYRISASTDFLLSTLSLYGETTTHSARIGTGSISHSIAGQMGYLLLNSQDAFLAFDARL